MQNWINLENSPVEREITESDNAREGARDGEEGINLANAAVHRTGIRGGFLV